MSSEVENMDASARPVDESIYGTRDLPNVGSQQYGPPPDAGGETARKFRRALDIAESLLRAYVANIVRPSRASWFRAVVLGTADDLHHALTHIDEALEDMLLESSPEYANATTDMSRANLPASAGGQPQIDRWQRAAEARIESRRRALHYDPVMQQLLHVYHLCGKALSVGRAKTERLREQALRELVGGLPVFTPA